MSVMMHKLGEYIERIERTNADGKYGAENVRGVTNAKGIIQTKANVEGRALEKFLVVGPNEFAVNRRVHDKLGLGLNQTDREFIFTNDYVAFRIKDATRLDPIYLYMFFCRDEFDRSVLYHAWGSATLFFNYDDVCDIELPVPPIEEQRKAVAAWQGLRKMKVENEQLAAPLMQLCRSYLEACKKKWPMTELGPMIEACDERNSDGRFNVESVRGISIDKKIIETKADMTNVSLRPYKLLQNEEFCVVPVTSRNGGKISMACNLDDETYIVSAAYDVFRVVKKKLLLPRFLFLFFSRPEFDRYARFNSWGSARESFSFQEMCRVKIPLPPLEVQQAIVDVYRCASEAKKIAAEADQLSRNVCPPLIQHCAKGAA